MGTTLSSHGPKATRLTGERDGRRRSAPPLSRPVEQLRSRPESTGFAALDAAVQHDGYGFRLISADRS